MNRATLGYLILAIGVILGLYWNYEISQDLGSEKFKRSYDVNQFLYEQCLRDNERDLIIIEALKDARRRAEVSLQNEPALRNYEVGQIQEQINKLTPEEGQCNPPER